MYNIGYNENEDEMLLMMNYEVEYFLDNIKLNDISNELINENIQAYIILGE